MIREFLAFRLPCPFGTGVATIVLLAISLPVCRSAIAAETSIARGAYLARITGCVGCHTLCCQILLGLRQELRMRRRMRQEYAGDQSKHECNGTLDEENERPAAVMFCMDTREAGCEQTAKCTG